MSVMLVPSERLGGTAEVAAALRCARQQIRSLRRREDFPQPVTELAATPVWDLRDIDEFASTWKRRS